jgi:hypothetical protein
MIERFTKVDTQSRSWWTRQRRSSLGQSLVEMAVTAPILLLILAAIIDMGRAIDAYISMTNGVREGARYGSLHPTDPGTIALRAVNETNGSGINFTGMSLSPSDIRVSFPGGGAYPGNPIRVTAEYDLPLYFGGIVRLSHIHLSKAADMAIMYSPVTPPLGP